MTPCLRALCWATLTVALLGTFLACGDFSHAYHGASAGEHQESLEVVENSSISEADAHVEPTETPTDSEAATRAEAGAHAYMFACEEDGDCIAVPKAGLCRNGVKEAINRRHEDAYKETFSKLRRGPCTFLLIRDRRVATCDKQAGRCVLVVPQKSSRLPAIFVPATSPP